MAGATNVTTRTPLAAACLLIVGIAHGTLTRGEYAAAVEKRFKAANPDNDGTLDDRELRSEPGRALQRLTR